MQQRIFHDFEFPVVTKGDTPFFRVGSCFSVSDMIQFRPSHGLIYDYDRPRRSSARNQSGLSPFS